jgi:hypothetical protein
MTEEKQERLVALQKGLETSRTWYAFCGTLGTFAILLVPLSILLGNKILGLCAVSWIAGSAFAFIAQAAKLKSNELREEIYIIELTDRFKVDLGNTAHRSVETGFGSISMN